MNKLKYSELFYSLQGEGRYVGVPSVFLRLFGCNFECPGFGQDKDKSKWVDSENMPHNQDHPYAKTLNDLPTPHVGCDSSFSWGKKWGHLAPNDDIETLIKKMNGLTNWYGQKTLATMSGCISESLKQDDGVHLVITGGEPLLKGFQPSLRELILSPELKTRFVTFETNGTQVFDIPRDELTERELAPPPVANYPLYMGKYGVSKNSGITWSVSPKLSNSGETWLDAIVPEALLSYNKWPHSYLYLKFVVRDEDNMREVEEAVKMYNKAGVEIDAIYIMPETGDIPRPGVSKSSDTDNIVANLALKYGYKFSPRLHIQLFGNTWGT